MSQATEASITCPICSRTSFHRDDVRYGYCGHCHAFTRDCVAARCTRPTAVIFGNVAACRPHATVLAAAR